MLIRIKRDSGEEGVKSLLREADVIEKPGYIFFCNDRNGLVRASLPDDAESVLQWIKGTPEAFPKKIGRFCWILYDKAAETVSFGTDIYGMGKVYYLKTDDCLYIADRPSHLTEAEDMRFHIDFTAWAEFLCFSYILGDRTFFSEIKTVFPDAYMQVSLRAWTIEQVPCFSLRGIPEDESIVYEDAVEKCTALLRQAVARAVPKDGEEVLVPLSGGYDSRCLAGLICSSLGADRADSITFCMDDGSRGDELCAEKTARFLGISQKLYELEGDYFFRDIENYLDRVNYESYMYVDFMCFFQKAAASFPKGATLLDGYGGDRLLRIARMGRISDEPGTEQFYESFFRRNLARRLERCSDPRNRAELYYLAKKGLVEELRRCGDNITVFYLYNRNARNMSYALKLEGEWFREAAPFMDRDLLRYALTLPKSVRSRKEFYPDILNHIMPGLGDLSSTNDENADYPRKPFLVDTPHWISNMKTQLGDYWENIGGIYDPAFAWQTLDELSGTGANLTNIVFPFLIYKKWREHYRNQLDNCSLGGCFASQKDAPELAEAFVSCKTIPFFEITERRRCEAVWKEYVSCNPRRSRNRMKMLFTMDVEGYCGEAKYVRHAHGLTDNYDPNAAFHQLILGGTCAGSSVLEKLSGFEGIPFTFFVEPFSPAYTSLTALREVFEICSSGENEAALHCHPFAISREILEEIGIPWNGYMSFEGFTRIVGYEINLYRQALRDRFPTSFRSGSLILYPEHYRALRACGICVDASGFLGNTNDFSGFGDRIQNEPLMVDQGIYEIPITTFYDIRNKGAKRKLDFNVVSYPQKLECIARNYTAGTKAVTMLMHSWSFSDYTMIDGKYGKLLDKYHGAVSQAALDELRYLAEFTASLGEVEFTTCRDLYRDEVQPYAVDISGEAEYYPVYPLPPEYGKLRQESLDGFLDLTKVMGSSSRPGWQGAFLEKGALVLKLPNTKQPMAGDWSKASFSMDTAKGMTYCVSVELDCPYYNEKYRGRNSIRYMLDIDGQTHYSNFITEPNRDELVQVRFTASGEQTVMHITVECIRDEKPWNWGQAARVFVKHVHIKQVQYEGFSAQ